MRFVSLGPSPKPDKRLVIVFTDPKKTVHFGARGGSTYLDHHDPVKRANYLARHRVNEDWSEVNAGSLAAHLLWGKSTDLETNLRAYLRRYRIRA
jgi:hypothetical protein